MNSEFLSPMFPYSPTDNLRGNYGLPSSNEDIIMPSDCYWIGPSIGFPMSNMNPDHSVTNPKFLIIKFVYCIFLKSCCLNIPV